ncbi:hypothetical protein GYB22_08975 [bacterium]|nr:hypothetical protein [bacterium]
MKSVFAFVVIALIGCNNAKPKIEGWVELDKEIYNVQYPPAWELRDQRQMNTEFILLAPADGDDDLFRENINLLIQQLPAETNTLDKYIARSEQDIKKMIDGSEILVSERKTDENGEYHILKYSGRQQIYNFVFEQQVRIMGDKAYCITFAAEQQNYPKYKETGEKILNSFYIK